MKVHRSLGTSGRRTECLCRHSESVVHRINVSSASHHHFVDSHAASPRSSTAWQRHKPHLAMREAAAVADAPTENTTSINGHSALLHSLGDVGDIPAAYMPWVLRIAAACSHTSGGDSQAAMADISRGINTWRASINRGLLPDDEAIQQLQRSNEAFTRGV